MVYHFTLLLEEVYRRAGGGPAAATLGESEKNPIMVPAGKKAAQTWLTSTYTYEIPQKGREYFRRRII